jgi:translation initiation factor IF-2
LAAKQLRVFELAKELDVTSKAILDKCRAEDLELKNHMATLTAGLAATIREWFSEPTVTMAATAEEKAEHVDLTKARAEAKKQRRRKKAEEEALAVAEAPPALVAEAPQVAVEAATAVAVAPAAEAPAAVEAPPAETPTVEAVVEAPPTAPTEPPAAPPQPPREAEQPKAPAPPVGAGKPPIKPAGPQVVPAPARLKGPRVVRVERPDFVRHPPPRAAAVAPLIPPTLPAAAKRGKGTAVEEEEEGAGKKKPKRRSPRRHGGRSADSGEKLKEWRNQDLLERTQRLAAAGGGLRRRRATVARKPTEGSTTPTVRVDRVEIEEPITVKRLSAAAGIKTSDIIRKLMELNVSATINQTIDRDTAEAVVVDYGIELAVLRAMTAEETLIDRLQARAKGSLTARAPVVTFLGHVDHGKTSLLDRIREASVAAGEAGGITQHIGAYRYDKGNAHVVFLDTPGHEAFTAMRARGANMTDVVILVVAADDGVMPQTVEALSHAKAAKVPIVVALNKIDLPNANEQKVLGQLAEQGLHPREWGGQTEVVRTSAVTGQGIEDLVTTLSLEAELLELVAEQDAPPTGYVIEAQMDPGMGIVARLLVLDGTLKVGDILLAGKGYGRVRQILDGRRRPLDQAGPSTPVEVAGLDEAPEAGDRFFVVKDLDEARAIAEEHRQHARSQSLAAVPQRTLESLLQRIEAGQANEVPLIIKADVQGSLEAITSSLAKLNTDEARVNVLHAGLGGISAGDVSLAEASDAVILGFNVVADLTARHLADSQGVDIRLYRIIYDLIEDIRKALEEGLAPEIREETLGRAEVRQVFKVSRIGNVAGCYVTDGLVNRNAKLRITRNNVVIEDNRSLESLKRFKDDAREVRAGLECGLKIAGYDDIKEGDVLEFYQKIEVARKL